VQGSISSSYLPREPITDPVTIITESSRLSRGDRIQSKRKGTPMASRQLLIDVPETVLLAEKTDEASFARELRMLAAVKLYELGRLSSGRAAELAGLSRVEFLLSLGRYRVFPLEAELQDLEAGHG
jgi:predicted HTH domain antitoxin